MAKIYIKLAKGEGVFVDSTQPDVKIVNDQVAYVDESERITTFLRGGHLKASDEGEYKAYLKREKERVSIEDVQRAEKQTAKAAKAGTGLALLGAAIEKLTAKVNTQSKPAPKAPPAQAPKGGKGKPEDEGNGGGEGGDATGGTGGESGQEGK